MSRTNRTLCQSVLFSVLFLILISLSSCSSYKPQMYADQSLQSSDTVTVTVTASAIIFEPKVSYTNAIVFYPGGKVNFAAYSPLLRELAENGIYCVDVHMPLDYAFTGINKAKAIMESRPDLHWYLAGHSLGGAMAAIAAVDSPDLEGLILLAAYSTKDLSQRDMKVLLAYGSNDQVLNRDNLAKYAGNLPATAQILVIEGGNHGQFGDYGFQKGDGEALISSQEQLRQTVDAVLQMMQ